MAGMTQSELLKIIIVMAVVVVLLAALPIGKLVDSIFNLSEEQLKEKLEINCEKVAMCSDYNGFGEAEQGCLSDYCNLKGKNIKCYADYQVNTVQNKQDIKFTECKVCATNCDCKIYKAGGQEKTNPCGCDGC